MCSAVPCNTTTSKYLKISQFFVKLTWTMKRVQHSLKHSKFMLLVSHLLYKWHIFKLKDIRKSLHVKMGSFFRKHPECHSTCHSILCSAWIWDMLVHNIINIKKYVYIHTGIYGYTVGIQHSPKYRYRYIGLPVFANPRDNIHLSLFFL